VEAEKQIYLRKKEIKLGFGGTDKTAEIKDYYEVEKGDAPPISASYRANPTFRKRGNFSPPSSPPKRYAEGKAFP
jgi:hypothetical protein